MSDYNGDDLEDEYMADEYDMDDLEDDMNAEFDGRDIDASSDSEVEDFDQLVCVLPLFSHTLQFCVLCIFFLIHNGVFQNKAADTSAAQARNGKDIQGIPWDRLNTTRKEYRKTRLEQYKNYENIPNSGEESAKVNCISCFFLRLFIRRCTYVDLFSL